MLPCLVTLHALFRVYSPGPVKAQAVSRGIYLVVDDDFRQHGPQDSLLQLYRCLRMIPQPHQILTQCCQPLQFAFSERLGSFPRGNKPSFRFRNLRQRGIPATLQFTRYEAVFRLYGIKLPMRSLLLIASSF